MEFMSTDANQFFGTCIAVALMFFMAYAIYCQEMERPNRKMCNVKNKRGS